MILVYPKEFFVLAEKFVPITKKSVRYIVYAVVFNEKGELLMVQEAKKSVFGLWYLPTGTVEPNETLEVGPAIIPFIFS